MKIKIEIKNRWTGKVIFEFKTENKFADVNYYDLL